MKHRASLFLVCLLALTLHGVPAAAQPKVPPNVPVSDLLAKPYVREGVPGFPGIEEDPKITLREVLDLMTEHTGAHFNTNDRAFREAHVQDVLDQKVAEQSIPRLATATLAAALQKVLDRIQLQDGGWATYMVRPGVIEITTTAAMRAEVWGSDYKGPYLPLVQANFDRLPLRSALEVLEEQTGYSIVLDARVDEKADVPVTARLRNMPLDTAVRMLADMAGLRVALNDNALYVSNEERALRPRSSGAYANVVGPGPRHALSPTAKPAASEPDAGLPVQAAKERR